MHIQFTVLPQTTIAQIDRTIDRIGNPKLIFHDYYFCGDVDSKYVPILYDLKTEGKIENLGFLVISDNPVPDMLNDSD